VRLGPIALGTLGVAALLGVGAGVTLGTRLLGRPPAADDAPAPDLAAGLRFQGTVAQLLLRQGGLSSRDEPLVVSAPELSAFLSEHLVIRRLALRPVIVRVGPGWVQVVGRTEVGQLAAPGRLPAGLAPFLPGSLRGLEVWLGVRGHVLLDQGTARLVVEEASIGQQPVPQTWLWRLLGQPGGDALVWQLPKVVDRLELTPGRIVLHTRRAPRP
jgi:hypothetical protein